MTKPQQQDTSAPVRERERSDSYARSRSYERQEAENSKNRTLILIISILLFIISGALIFTNQVDSLLKSVFTIFSFSFAIGGFFSFFAGTAKITLGKWFKASGAIAVALFLLVLVLQATGLIKIAPEALSQARIAASPQVQLAN